MTKSGVYPPVPDDAPPALSSKCRHAAELYRPRPLRLARGSQGSSPVETAAAVVTLNRHSAGTIPPKRRFLWPDA